MCNEDKQRSLQRAKHMLMLNNIRNELAVVRDAEENDEEEGCEYTVDKMNLALEKIDSLIEAFLRDE